MMNNNAQLISFSCSETPIAPIPESDLWLISSSNDRHGSWQCSRQCLLRGGRMESLSSVQVPAKLCAFALQLRIQLSTNVTL